MVAEAVANPVKFENRHGATRHAAVFVHGFTGDGVKTWGTFPERLTQMPELGAFDYWFWQYPSKLSLSYAVTKWFWENDPDITTIGQGLRTLLDGTIDADDRYQEIKLVAHSMGGLVVQAYVIEELRRIREAAIDVSQSKLSKINEIVMYATPSGGLRKARFGSFLKNQIADMSDISDFVTNLRTEWKEQVDDRRDDPDSLGTFGVTVVGGMKDRFVPPESALEPFPFDEQLLVPGNHVQLVKPEKVGTAPVDVLVQRLLRPRATLQALQAVHGRSAEAVKLMNQVRGADEMLGDVESLMAIAGQLLGGPVEYPTVERALGLALGRKARHQTAVDLLRRYLAYELPDGATPFANDVHVTQQLAIAQSALGDQATAIATLNGLPDDVKTDPETLGITAGRIKRQWLSTGRPPALGRRALETYRAGYEAAVAARDVDQILYNGINAAFMSLATGKPHRDLAAAVLEAVSDVEREEYWVAASVAEALLLLGDYVAAADRYEEAFELTDNDRFLASTGIQAANIVDLLGSPAGTEPILEVFAAHIGDPAQMRAVEETVEEERDRREAENDAERTSE